MIPYLYFSFLLDSDFPISKKLLKATNLFPFMLNEKLNYLTKHGKKIKNFFCRII